MATEYSIRSSPRPPLKNLDYACMDMGPNIPCHQYTQKYLLRKSFLKRKQILGRNMQGKSKGISKCSIFISFTLYVHCTCNRHVGKKVYTKYIIACMEISKSNSYLQKILLKRNENMILGFSSFSKLYLFVISGIIGFKVAPSVNTFQNQQNKYHNEKSISFLLEPTFNTFFVSIIM